MTAALDFDDSTTEGVFKAELMLVEGFDAGKAADVEAGLTNLFGKPTSEHASSERLKELRGRPFLLGRTARKSWRIDPHQTPIVEHFRSNGEAGLLWANQIQEIALHLWSVEHLPYLICYIQVTFRDLRSPDLQSTSSTILYAMDRTLDTLPGRLLPNIRLPRVARRWQVCAKVSETRMNRMMQAARTAGSMSSKDSEKEFRADLVAATGGIGVDEGELLVAQAYGTVMAVYGEGVGYAGATHGSFSALLISAGDPLTDGEFAPEGTIQLYVPENIACTSWLDLNFMPYLITAQRFAAHTFIEAGKAGESLGIIPPELRQASLEITARKRLKHWKKLQPALVALSARIEQLIVDLDRSAHRTSRDPQAILHPKRFGHPPVLRIPPSASMWGATAGHGSNLLAIWLQDKHEQETRARALLQDHGARIQSMLSLMATDYQWQASTRMLFWAAISGAGTLAALIVGAWALLKA